MIEIGIDSGKKGGVAYMENGVITHAHNLYPISDFIGELHQIIHDHTRPKVRVILEEVPPYIGRIIPSSASFKLGVSYGECRGICMGALVQMICIRPQTWQKGLSGLQGKKGNERKKILKDHAFQLYPSLKPTLQTCDAILLLHQSKHII